MSEHTAVANDLVVRYENTSITNATQFLISPAREQVVMDFSSGIVVEKNHEQVLPIHVRLGLTWAATRRLAELLNEVVERYDPDDGAVRLDDGDPPRGLPTGSCSAVRTRPVAIGRPRGSVMDCSVACGRRKHRQQTIGQFKRGWTTGRAESMEDPLPANL